MTTSEQALFVSARGGLPSAVEWAQLLIASRLHPGSKVVDATLGNGQDALFLLRQILPTGHLYGFDVQSEAIENSRRLLESEAVPTANYDLLQISHTDMERALPQVWQGQVNAIMFNLGYLPGADKNLITQAETTVPAIQASLRLLIPGGLISVVVYPGHAGGAEEALAVANWAAALSPRAFEVQHLRPVNRQQPAPECWVILKSQAR